MSWLARLKKTGVAPGMPPTKPTKPAFVGFVAPDEEPLQKTQAALSPANTASLDPDRWCWPHSSAMNGAEIDTFIGRQELFTSKGMSLRDAEAIADKLVFRDRDLDDRRICLECSNLQGLRPDAWRCGAWQWAGITHRASGAELSAALVFQLERCGGFKAAQGPNKSAEVRRFLACSVGGRLTIGVKQPSRIQMVGDMSASKESNPNLPNAPVNGCILASL